MATKLINTTRVPQQVNIICNGGVRASVRIMARRQVELPDGAYIDYSWVAVNPGVIRIVTDAPAIDVAAAVNALSTPASAHDPVSPAPAATEAKE